MGYVTRKPLIMLSANAYRELREALRKEKISLASLPITIISAKPITGFKDGMRVLFKPTASTQGVETTITEVRDKYYVLKGGIHAKEYELLKSKLDNVGA